MALYSDGSKLIAEGFAMKLGPHCRPCLADFARRMVDLSSGDGALLSECFAMIETLYTVDQTPPAIANRMLAFVRERTGVDDPYALRKEEEFRAAEQSSERFRKLFPSSLEGVLQFSSLGNALDFFIDELYEVDSFRFSGDVERIAGEIDASGPDVLMLADNVGEFLFDLPLIRFLEGAGKRVFYAVKERPVQNDLSMKEVAKFGLQRLFPRIISTGTGEVGMKRADLKGPILDLWEGDSLVIAKGMGNYETISEFAQERQVVYIMKVKCKTVSEMIGKTTGTYTALLGGDHGNEKRLLSDARRSKDSLGRGYKEGLP
jgi:damage-control phosphatase, subfamily I